MTPLPPLHDKRFASEPMSLELSKVFIGLSLAEKGKAALPIAALIDDLGADALGLVRVAILVGRLELTAIAAPGLRFTTQAVLLAAYMCESPGDCVVWAWELVCLARRGPCDITAMSFAFANGFPTRAAMTQFWDGQKEGIGNRLDRPETWRGEQP